MGETTEGGRPVVLVVDDDDDIRQLISMCAARLRPPFDIRFAATAAEACAKLSEGCYDALVLDVNLLGPTGVTVAAEAHEKCPTMPKAFYTAYDRSMTQEHAAQFDMPIWTKPLTPQELFQRIGALIATREAGRDGGSSRKLSVPGAVAAIASMVLGTAAGG